jgi:putative spermidine/putrescine transport system permease protein
VSGSGRAAHVGILLCLPLLLVLVVCFVWPIWNLLLLSVHHPGPGPAKGSLTLEHYRAFITDEYFREILWHTLGISAVVALLSVLLGYPVAYYIAAQTSSRMRAVLMFCVTAPMMVSIVVRTYGWVVLLGPTGVINSFLSRSGVTDGPVKLMYNDLGIAIGLLNVLLPFMVLSINSSLVRIQPALLRAAANLGASPAHVFLRVTLPLSLPGILTGVILVFTLASSYFVTPAILGGSRARLLSFVAYEYALELLNWPFAAVVTVILFVIICICTYGLQKALEWSRWGAVLR